MANQTCASTLKVCALRTGRLDDAGALDPGSENLYISDSLVLLGFTPSTPDRERLELLNGCGDQCVLYIGDPKAVESADLTMNLCSLDSELIEMLAGGTVITEGSYDSVGYLAPTDSTVNTNGVFLEVWTYAWSGRSRKLKGGAPAFWRFGFPKVTWTVGEITLQNDIAQIPLTGSAVPNSSFGDGITADAWPVSFGDSVYGWYLDDAIPTAVCGYQTLAA